VPYLNDEAVVLNSLRSREKDKVTVLMTRNHGLVRAVARRAFSPTSRLGTALEMLSTLKVQLFRRSESQELFTLCQAVLIERSPLLEADYETLSCGSFLAEVISVVATAEHDESELFRILAQAQVALAQDVERQLLAVAFFASVTAIAGIAPQVGACCRCAREISEECGEWFFLPVSGNFCCAACVLAGESAMRLSAETLRWLEHALQAPFQDCLRYPHHSGCLLESAKVLSEQVQSHLGVKFRTLPYIVEMHNS